MTHHSRGLVAIMVLLAMIFISHTANGQKSGGILRIYSLDSPGSMSALEEATMYAIGPMAGVFNNLVMFDQHVPQNSLASIVPDLAAGWRWSEDGTTLTFALRQGVKWHDGQPFTASDVKCTWDLLMGTAPQQLRINPRKSLYGNLSAVTINGDWEVAFRLNRPQPAFPMLLAEGYSVIYPCHVSPEQMRLHPIGTGPFRFIGFKPNEDIKVVRNLDYWKADRPYLDGIDYTIVKDASTATLAFTAGKFDITFPYSLTIPLMKNIASQMPQATCELDPGDTGNYNLLINFHKPPFDNPQLRQAMTLALDRRAFVDIISQGYGQIGGVLQPPPGGLWGLTPEQLQALPGYSVDVDSNRAQARQIMQQLGYGPDKRLNIKVTSRNLQDYREPAVLLIDQLKQAYIDGELELVDTPQFFPKILRKDFAVALNAQLSGPDPDGVLSVYYGCGATRNFNDYCNREVDKLIEVQSREADPARRKGVLLQIERTLVVDNARPILFYGRRATCWQPYVKGLTIMANSQFNGWRLEDVWLDK